MASLNKVFLMGNITRDLELKYLPSNTAVCDFGLATNRTWTGPDGVKKEEVTFVDCTSFGKQAEILAKFKKKGDPLFIEGRLKLDQWEAQDGSKRSKLKVVVDNFQFLNRGQPGGYGAPGGDAGDYGGESAPAQPAARPAYRPQQGRPGAQSRPAPAPSAGYDPAADAPNAPDDDGSQIKDEDIPF